MSIPKYLTAAVLLLCFAISSRAANSVTVGDVRVQALSPTLVRLEMKGPRGFEDRQTFHVINRDWSGVELKGSAEGNEVVIRGGQFVVRVPGGAKSLDGAKVQSSDGQKVWTFDGTPANNAWLPGGTDANKAWAIADAPRIVRASQGAIPATNPSDHSDTSGWDLTNDSPDVYVFLGDAKQVRADFLKLTGPTEMPPLFALGAWDSRWYAYTEQTALQQIADYRKRQIPLDVLVIDTDWRKGGSHGYDVNTEDFPDLPKFFKEAHDQRVRIMFNDHPEPVAKTALDPKEMQYRFDNLSRLLNAGLDIWWFDRNWSTHLLSPAKGLRLEAWGMQVYHDSTLAVRPNQRPMIMANVDGIDNGKRNQPPDTAVHRFPIQWTGDIGPSYDFLRRAVENAVHAGVASAFAYESDDIGGHTSDPNPEGYIRWIEYGALSPIYRPHCTKDHERMPWAFGDEAEKIARDYVQMRYRLLPVFYAAARENFDTGEPILRRLDLDYPQYKEASREDQYLIGHNILVAPVLTSMDKFEVVPASMFHTPDGQPGLAAEYFDNRDLTGEPAVKRVDPQIDFDWEKASADPKIPVDNWGARWTGKVGPIPEDGQGDRILAITSDDGARIWIDGEKVVDAWHGQDSVTNEAKVALKPGKTYEVKIEYMDMQFNAMCRLSWRKAHNESLSTRELWVPPGTWIDAWSGEAFTGPKSIELKLPLSQTGLLIKSGAVLALAPAMQHTAEKPWNPITLDVYPAAGTTSEMTLYEDDGISNAYKTGACRKTPIKVNTNEAMKDIHIDIGAAQGRFDGAATDRAWKVRLHLPSGAHVSGAEVDGQALQARKVAKDSNAMPFAVDGGSRDGAIVELVIPSKPVVTNRVIHLSMQE